MPRNTIVFGLPKRLWTHLCEKTGLPEKSWAEQKKENLQRMAGILTGDPYRMAGKTTFKEEFVTCGGVDLREVDFRTMESRICPGLYFSGEVLDIDGITGGFNFQAAWSTGWVAAQAIALALEKADNN